MNDTFMKERPVLPLLLSMGLPMALSMLVNSLYNIVDSFFVAQISEDAMTALSLVFPIQNFINAVGIGFGVGINAVISLRGGPGGLPGAGAVFGPRGGADRGRHSPDARLFRDVHHLPGGDWPGHAVLQRGLQLYCHDYAGAGF